MKAPPSLIVALVCTLAPPVVAAEPWPPTTAPKVDTPDEVAPAPRVEPTRPVPLAPPPAPPPVIEEEVARPPNPASDTVVVRAAPVEVMPAAPLVGSRDGQFFLRARGERFVLLPTARLQLDGNVLATSEPNARAATLALSRARLEVGGWIGPMANFNLGVDFSSGPSLRHTDELISLAPWGDRAILQLGQFDAPFSLANRTSERYLDFGDRGVAIGAFAIPDNKDQGIMVQGANPARSVYYSAGVLNGEGPQVTGVDGHVDVMARAFVAPFAFRDPDALREITLGGSLWTGDRSMRPALGPQTTPTGYTFLDPTLWWSDGVTRSPLELRQHGRLGAVGVELNAPFLHRYGVRFEWIAKRQPLSAVDLRDAARPTRIGGLTLSGTGTYVELWAWVLGDDRLLGAPAAAGLELPLRFRDLRVVTGPPTGVMLAARVERVDEDLSESSAARSLALGVASLGKTRITSASFAANVWYTRRARLLIEYTFNHLDGNTPYINGLDDKNEHELLFRTALAL